jgi:hypothetical protein
MPSFCEYARDTRYGRFAESSYRRAHTEKREEIQGLSTVRFLAGSNLCRHPTASNTQVAAPSTRELPPVQQDLSAESLKAKSRHPDPAGAEGHSGQACCLFAPVLVL